MRFLRNAPIKRKLLWITLITCSAALALALTVLFWFQSVNFRSGFSAQLQMLGTVIAQNSTAPLTFDDPRSALEVLSTLKVNPHVTSAWIYTGDGRLFARFGSEEAHNAAAAAREGEQVIFEDGYAHLSLPIKVQEGKPGRLQLCARFDEKYHELLSLYAVVMGAVLVGSLAAIAGFSSVIHRIITHPIMALAEVARNVTERQDYRTRAAEIGRDEVGLLTRTFNQMLDQIESRDQRLQESQQRFEVAVMGSSDGLWDWDLLTNTVFFSARWKSMFGYADEELENNFETFRGLIHPDDVERVMTQRDAYLQGSEVGYEVEFRARHKSGKYRWILCRGAALRDKQGRAVRFAGSHSDITERKLAEEEIRRGREKFESLVNSINGIVWEADADTLAMRFVSDQAEGMLGYPARLWLEDPGFREKTLHPDDRAVTMEASRRRMIEGTAYQLEFRVIAADGRVVWLRESVAVELKNEIPVLLRGVAIDITEQKLAAEKLLEIQRQLVEASRLAGMAEIATGVLHNVGNVLNCVNVSSGMIADTVRKSKADRLVKASRMLNQNRERLGEFLTDDPKGRMIPDFLDALSGELLREQAKLTAETTSLQQNIDHIKQIVAMQQSYAKVSGALENLALRDLVEDALRMGTASLSRNQIEVVRDYDVVPAVLVDRHVVLQILINLINNARQAMDARPQGRRLELRIRRGDRRCVRVEVIDNGEGIPRENLAKIFNHGFTTKKSGHGFGLHSGANAAKQMGGSLVARSDGPGAGATFILEFPINQNATPTAAAPRERELIHAG
jgi:PAS domain S-box-containing protein